MPKLTARDANWLRWASCWTWEFVVSRSTCGCTSTKYKVSCNQKCIGCVKYYFFRSWKNALWSWSQMIDMHWNMSAGKHRVCSEHPSRLESNHKFVCQVEICWVSMVERLDLLSTHTWTMHTNQHCEPCIFIGSLAMDAFIRHCFNEICPHASYPDRFDLMSLSFEWTPLLRCRRYASGAGREKNVPWRLRIDKPSCWKVGAGASMDWIGR